MTSHRHDALVRLVASRQPACGRTKVVAIDGPSGSGKTELATELAAATGAAVLHLDDVYPGWHGLAATPALVRPALAAIAVGETGEVPRWSWVRSTTAPPRRLPDTDLLIIDGVGSGAAVLRSFLSLLVWVDADTVTRRARALARDGGTYAPYWEVWAEQEREHFALEQTRAHADVVVQTGA